MTECYLKGFSKNCEEPDKISKSKQSNQNNQTKKAAHKMRGFFLNFLGSNNLNDIVPSIYRNQRRGLRDCFW